MNLSQANIQVVGAIVGFGTFNISEQVLIEHNNFPTIIVTGVCDDISPVYDNHIFYSSNAPETRGTINLYQNLMTLGYPAGLLISSQKGHGWSEFGKPIDDGNGGNYCGKTVPDFAIALSENNIQNMANSYALPYLFNTYSVQRYKCT